MDSFGLFMRWAWEEPITSPRSPAAAGGAVSRDSGNVSSNEPYCCLIGGP
jgi:hypothetical protein